MHSGMSRQQFEQVVSDAMDDIPQDLLDRIDNVAIVVEDEPPADWQARGWDGHEHGAGDGHSELLGLYLSLIHISEPTRLSLVSRMPSSA